MNAKHPRVSAASLPGMQSSARMDEVWRYRSWAAFWALALLRSSCIYLWIFFDPGLEDDVIGGLLLLIQFLSFGVLVSLAFALWMTSQQRLRATAALICGLCLGLPEITIMLWILFNWTFISGYHP